MKYYFLLIFLLLLPLISSQESLIPVKLDSCSNILQTVSNASFCQLTLLYPNQSKVLDNVTMTKIGDIYNYTFCGNSIQGQYNYITQCDPNGILDDPIPVTYLVNGYGSEVSTSQIIGYGILLIISFIVFIFTIYGAFAIPFSNNRNEEGKVISISDLKYLKVVAWIFAYLEFLFIISIAKNMALGFLLNDGLYTFLNIVYNLLLICLLPLFPLLIFFTIIVWINDKKTLSNIHRGIFEE